MPSEARSTTAPTPLRLASFLLTAGGGLAAGLGALLPWAVLAYPGFGPSEVPGVDLWEGRVALACALAVLVAIPASRLVGRPAAWGVAILAAGLLVAGVAAGTLTRSQARLGGPPAAAIARDLARATGLPEAALRQRLEDSEPDLRLGAGLPLALGGGALSALGGLLTVAWARRRPAGAGPSGPS